MDSPTTPTVSTDAAAPAAAAPAPAAAPTATAAGPTGPSPVAQLREGLSSAFASLNPLAQKVNLGFMKATQLAEEQIGTAEKTELPAEYRALEAKVDRIRAMHENLSRATTQFLSPGTSTTLKLQVADVFSNVAGAVHAPQDNAVTDKLRAVNLDVDSSHQVLGSHFTKSGETIGDASPLGSALVKCGDAHDKLGRARLQLNLEIYEKFVKQLSVTLEGSIKQAMICRKNVQSARVNLDALKKAAKSAKPENTKVKEDLAAAQLTFDSAVQAATVAMQEVIASVRIILYGVIWR